MSRPGFASSRDRDERAVLDVCRWHCTEVKFEISAPHFRIRDRIPHGFSLGPSVSCLVRPVWIPMHNPDRPCCQLTHVRSRSPRLLVSNAWERGRLDQIGRRDGDSPLFYKPYGQTMEQKTQARRVSSLSPRPGLAQGLPPAAGGLVAVEWGWSHAC